MDISSVKIKVIAGADHWIEGKALDQLQTSAAQPGMVAAVGLPDLHPGRGIPVGAAFLSKDIFYPHLIGNDIGCGIALFQSQLPLHKIRLDKWEKKLAGLSELWDGLWPAGVGLEAELTDFSGGGAGSIGAGNHFAEFTKIVKNEAPDALAKLGVDPKKALLLVHSGSRGLGEQILSAHVERFGFGGLEDSSSKAADYLQKHDAALAWAGENRRLIAARFAEALGTRVHRVCDLFHNLMERGPEGGWLHRKGAAKADAGPLVIAGSRGSHSYLVEPLEQSADNLWTVAHGAGRKWNRKEAKPRLAKRFSAEELRRTKFGSRVMCSDRGLLYEEAPEAYKNIDQVIDALVDAGLVRVLAVLEPLLTFKTMKER